MFRHVNIVGSISIPLPKRTLVEMLWNISRIPEFDLKADRVDVKPETDKTGAYEVWGRFLGISWNRPFLYFLNDDGFYLREANFSGPEPAIQGGFMVQEIGPTESTIIHYEQYWFARRLVPLRPLLVAYLNWSVRKELEILKSTALKEHGNGSGRA
jgi:hypothetical protein